MTCSKHKNLSLELAVVSIILKNQSIQLLGFIELYLDKIAHDQNVALSSLPGYVDLINDYTAIIKNKFNINFKLNISYAFNVCVINMAFAKYFLKLRINLSDQNILKFIESNWRIMSYMSILSSHEFYLNSNYFKSNKKYYRIINEPTEFVFSNFQELFTNDNAYALGLFVFLDNLGIEDFSEFILFEPIYQKGKIMINNKISREDIIECVNLKANAPNTSLI